MIQYKFLNILVRHDREIIDKLKVDFEKKNAYLEKLRDMEDDLKAQRIEIEDKKKTLILKRDEKNVILSKIRQEKVLYHSAIEELEESTRKIEEMISQFREGEESEDREFVSRMGKLKPPVDGIIVKSFGKEIDPRFHTIIYRKGVIFRTDENTSVRSIFNGVVVFAGAFSGYGNLMIIKHGENYYSVYARLDELYKKEGDKVKTGEIIGRTGFSGLFPEQGLYFELRKGGKPLDPEVWLSKN